jgi:AraC-like DNA-binding protein
MTHHIEILLETETLSAVIFHCPGKTSHCEHALEEYSEQHEIVLPLDGVFMRYDAFGHFVADSNHMLFFNAEQSHEITHPVWGNDTSLILSFADDLLSDLTGQIEQVETPFTDAYALLDTKQQLMKQQLLMMLAQSEHYSKLEIAEHILWKISTLLRSNHPKKAADSDKITIEQREAVFATQCILNQSLYETITLNDIAQQVHYSEYALCRLFKQQVGTTIYQYLTHLRLAQALQDLTEKSQKNIGDIGMELGFSSPSHFSTRFLTTFGMTPTDFRQQATGTKICDMHKNLKAPQMLS